MSEMDKTMESRAYVKGTITSDLEGLDRLLKTPGAESTLSKNLALSLITEVEDKLRLVDSLTETLCLELCEKEMLDEIENNFVCVFEVRAK